MSQQNFKIGEPVQVAGKPLKGYVAFVGLTNFSPGKWIGVVLDEELGKNNGSVKGVSYFKCAPNHGLFVRPTQLIGLSEAAEVPAEVDAPTSTANILKTTIINQPKQPKQFLSSSSQLSLHVAAPIRERSATMVSTPLAIAPKRSKTSVSPSESFCCSKRASFVETGFLEILRPQFTPGQPLRSPSFSISSTAPASASDQLSKLKELEGKIVDLTEEIIALKKQKDADKCKLHELEKIRLQNEQLSEFKAKILEQQCLLQRELHRTRQDVREAHDSKGKYKRELDEMSESIEMLTLDKEMAEERTETLQMELELAQERIEELTLDVDILRAENEGTLSLAGNCHKDDNLPTAGELRKLEQYNKRLRETVVRLRDVLTQEKQHLQKATKELETKNSEISELKKIKEVLSKRIDILEMHNIDLKEQVDAALGAESMVESLADAKLELEDRVKLLEEEVSELEALEEIHEQLIESNQELEMDLRDEVELLNSTIKTLQHEKDETLELVYDRDITIMKFRELVKALNEQQLQLKDITTTSTSEDFSTISNPEEPQSIDFKQVFSVTKAYGRAIDAQLNAAELKLNRKHVEYLLAFVSDDFLLRGGEHDVILVLLLLQRITDKVDIICSAINEKFPSSCEFGKDAIFEGFSVHRFAFRSKCMYFLRSLKVVLQQLIFGLNNCDYDVCSHAAIYRGEIEVLEKNINEMVHQLKSGLLDENSPIEPIERTLSFFNALHTNLISPHDQVECVDEHQLYAALIDVFDVGLDSVNTNAALLHTIIQLGDENTESFRAMQFLMENTNNFKQQLKKLHRKLPATSNAALNGIQSEKIQHIQMTNDHFGRLINILAASAREATKSITSSANNQDCCIEVAIDHERLWRIITLNCAKFGPEENQLPIPFIQHCVQLVDEQINEFLHFIKENECVRSSNMNTVFVRSSASTLLQRSMLVKQHFEDIKAVKQTLVERERDIKTLKYVAKMKQNDFSELQIRKEIAERNLSKLLAEQDNAITHISNYIENLENDVRSKDVSMCRTLATLELKLSTLEQTCCQLAKRLDSNSHSVTMTTDESTREITMLNSCLRQERVERSLIQSNSLRERIRKFEPIFVPQRTTNKNFKDLEHELRSLKNDWILSHITIETNSQPESELKRSRIQGKSNALFRHITDAYFTTNPHRAAACDFGTFSTSEMRALLQ